MMPADDGPTFRVGMSANGVQFRHSDVNGRPIDVSAEGDTARSERIWHLQDRWMPHEPPSCNSNDILAEWMAQSPENRLSKFAQNIAEHGLLGGIQVESEPGPGEQPSKGRPH